MGGFNLSFGLSGFGCSILPMLIGSKAWNKCDIWRSSSQLSVYISLTKDSVHVRRSGFRILVFGGIHTYASAMQNDRDLLNGLSDGGYSIHLIHLVD